MEATVKFQEIAAAYAILGSEERKKKYDESGDTSEDSSEMNMETFIKELWKDLVSGKTIEEFKVAYQGSDEETADLLEAYEEFKGNMDKVFEHVMCSSILEDGERFKRIIESAIDRKAVKVYPAFVKESKAKTANRVKRAKKEAKEAEKMQDDILKQESQGGDKSLQDLILARRERNIHNIDKLIDKYGGAPKKGKRAMVEPTEEEFQAASKRLRSKR